MVSSIKMSFKRVALVIWLGCSLLAAQINGCPTSETLRNLCYCQSSQQVSGVILDCSGSSFNDTVELLRTNRAQLGLIQELLLRNASANVLISNVFQGLYIKKLDLSSNQIENIEPDAFQGLQNVLQILSLRDNNLKDVPTAALRGLTTLAQLDLSNNQIGNLGSEIFYNTPKVFDVNLSGNKICRVNKEAFKNVKQSIQTLNLGGNCLDEIPAAAIRGFQQLLALHFHENHIARLEPLQFMNLPFLSLVNLAGNRIQRMHRQAFLNVPNLKFMYLSDNEIDELEAQQFSHFEKLELLDLSRNKLRVLPSYAFASMPSLSQLYLASNEIVEIEPQTFSNSSLVILLLSENKIVRLTGDMFTGLNSLQQLSLKNNQISLVAQNTFYLLPGLVVLDLSYNNISVLQPATFLAQLGLFLLDLSHNSLRQTPLNAFNQRIVTIVLQENPLVCTERVHVIQNNVGIFVPGTVDRICGGVGSDPSNGQIPQLVPANPSGPTDSPSFVIEHRPTPSPEAPFPPQGVPFHGVTAGTESPRVITFPPIPPEFFTSPHEVLVSVETATKLITHELPSGFLPVFPQTAPPTPGLQFPQAPGPVSPINPAFQLPQQPSPGLVGRPDEHLPIFTFTIPTQATTQRFTHFPPTPVQYPIRPTSPITPVIEEIPPSTGFNPAKPLYPTFNNSAGLDPFAVPNPWTGPTYIDHRSTSKPTIPTLPPDIVIAGPGEDPVYPPDWIGSNGAPSPEIRTLATPKKPVLKPGPSDAQSGPDRPNSTTDPSPSGISASTTIAVCLSVVIVVILIVFITLCVVRHRVQSKRSESSASRTSAYVAAQAARVGGFQHGNTSTIGTYGSGKYHHESLPKPPKTPQYPSIVPVTPVGNTWIYAPGGYGSSGSFYK